MSITIWEDREVRFDMPISNMRLRPGEKLLDRLDSIEDTKGNSGDKGRMMVTNLRIMWHSIASPRVNLSIGFNCVISTNTKTVVSKLRGTTQALHILTLNQTSRFEFIFTNLIAGNMRHFTSVMGVQKAYSSSRLYRDLKLRSSVVKEGTLQVLRNEQLYSTVGGVWNLSSDQGNLGTFLVTNVRVVWFADMNESFNISLPYLQIAGIQVRESKFGPALVINTVEESGGYVLGFRIDPQDRLGSLFKELSSLHTVYSQTPVFGVEYSWRDQPALASEPEPEFENIQEVDQTSKDVPPTLSAYLAEGSHLVDRAPIYCKNLGLAIETPRDGYSIKTLWEVIPSQ